MKEPVEALFPAYSRVAYRVIKAAVGTAMRTAYTIDVGGLHHVPSTGPAILAANHLSFIDSFFIPLVVPRRVTYLAKAEYWDSWKTRWFFDTVGQIPVRRQSSSQSAGALDAGCAVLHAGGLLGIYPEGTRSPDGRLYKGKTGVARMALAAAAPVVPVGLVGTRELMPKDAKMPARSGNVRITFGEPMTVPEAGETDAGVLRDFVDTLMTRICELSGQTYCDHYADRKGRIAAMAPAPLDSVAIFS